MMEKVKMLVPLLGFAGLLYFVFGPDLILQADGFFSPATAVKMGLLSEREAHWSPGVAYKKSAHGGYDYKEGNVMLIFKPAGHTSIDIPAECKRLGGCESR